MTENQPDAVDENPPVEYSGDPDADVEGIEGLSPDFDAEDTDETTEEVVDE